MDTDALFRGQLEMLFGACSISTLRFQRTGVDLSFTAVVDPFPARLTGVLPGDLRARAWAADLASVEPVVAMSDVVHGAPFVYWDVVSSFTEFGGFGLTLQLRPRPLVPVPAGPVCRYRELSETVTVPNSVIRVSANSVVFERAYFYGLKVVPLDGQAVTPNVGSVWIGENDGVATICPDEVTNDPAAPVCVPMRPDKSHNVANYRVRIPTPGDRVFVVYE